MDLFTMIGACLRRWYVTVPLVAFAGWLALQAYEAVPSLYTSSTSIVVLPAPQVVPLVEEEELPPEPENPYSGSGGARFAAVVLARNINTDVYRTRIGVTDPDVTFEASAGNQQPIISVDAFAPTPEQVLGTLEAVTASANEMLAEFQTEAGAPEPKLYRIAPAVPPDRVEDVTPSRWRSAGAIFALGLVVAAAVGTALDSLLRRRAQSRAARRRAADDAPAEADAPDESVRLAPPRPTSPESGPASADVTGPRQGGSLGASAPQARPEGATTEPVPARER